MGRPVAADNFLVPNATLIVELIIFALLTILYFGFELGEGH